MATGGVNLVLAGRFDLVSDLLQMILAIPRLLVMAPYIVYIAAILIILMAVGNYIYTQRR